MRCFHAMKTPGDDGVLHPTYFQKPPFLPLGTWMDPLAFTRLSIQEFNKRKEVVHQPIRLHPLILIDEVTRQWLPELHLSIIHTLLSLKTWARSPVPIFNGMEQALHTQQQG